MKAWLSDMFRELILSIFVVLSWSDFYDFEKVFDGWFCGCGAGGLR